MNKYNDGYIPPKKVKPLPCLKVYRDTYLSQENTDKIISFIEGKLPECLFQCFVDEDVALDIRWRPYRNLVGCFLEMKDKPDIDYTQIVVVDLVYEVSRRIRSAYKMSEVLILGKALEGLNKGELIDLKISEHSEKFWGANQKMVDDILSDFYVSRPDVWLAKSEAFRRSHDLYSTQPYFLLKEILIKKGYDKGVSAEEIGGFTSALLVEMARRIRKMCLLPN